DLAGVVRTRIGGEEHQGLGDLLGFGEPLEGLYGQQCLDVLIAGLGQQRGVDACRCQRVDADVEGGEFTGDRAGHADHGCLGGRVVGGHGQGDQARDGGEVDDRSPTGRLEQRCGCADGEESAMDIDAHDAVEILIGDVGEELRGEGLPAFHVVLHRVVDGVQPFGGPAVGGVHAGGVDEGVQLAVLGGDAGEGLVDGGGVCDVEGDGGHGLLATQLAVEVVLRDVQGVDG